MKITVRELGIISQAEIDVKPLTVLVGPNNASKTWLVYLLSGILGIHGYQTYAEAYSNDLLDSQVFLDKLVDDIFTKGSTSVDLQQFADEQGEQLANQVAAYAQTWLADYLGTNRADFSNLEVKIDFTDQQKHIRDSMKGASFTRKLSSDFYEAEALLSARKQRKDRKLYFHTTGENLSEQLSPSIVKEFVAEVLLGLLFQSLYRGVVVFPTERTTFITMSFDDEVNIKTRLISEDELNEMRTRSRPQSQVIGRFLGMIFRLYRSSFATRAKAAEKSAPIRRYIELAHLLQSQILGGVLDFSNPENGPGREILFRPAQESGELEMSVSSSMVKELAPLALYLRYLAQPGELIIIDEPEMNLHPEAQAKMVEFLAMLVNAGLHVLITTHSPYMVDHLENLITASEHLEQGARVQDDFFLQNKDAFLSREKISVYQIDHGTATNLFQEDGHIHWDTFNDVSTKVIQLYTELLEDGDPKISQAQENLSDE